MKNVEWKDLGTTKIATVLALFIIASLAGSIAFVKIALNLDVPWMSDYVKGPKLQKIELVNCTQLFDRDTGAIVKEVCRPPEQEAKIQELAENLRKLTGELNQTKADLAAAKAAKEQVDAMLSGLRKQIQEVQGKLVTARRNAEQASSRETNEVALAKGEIRFTKNCLAGYIHPRENESVCIKARAFRYTSEEFQVPDTQGKEECSRDREIAPGIWRWVCGTALD